MGHKDLSMINKTIIGKGSRRKCEKSKKKNQTNTKINEWEGRAEI